MAAPAPPRPIVIARQQNSARANGTTAGNQNQRGPPQPSAPQRTAPARTKVIIRRLAPGLTEDEFWKALGHEWKAGTEKVDWASFTAGKVSKDMSKPSIPARAYLHLTKMEYVAALSSAVREANFADAKSTTADPCLLGPPVLEMATYQRIPAAKPRRDARQGTIDQDPEFIAFLEELTNPVVKPAPLDAHAEKEALLAGDTVTPLVQFLRDKKANKGKDNTSAKGGKQARQEAKDSKTKASDKAAKSKDKESKEAGISDKKGSSVTKGEKTTREAVKVLNKQAASVQKTPIPANANQSSKAQPSATETKQPPAAPVERKRGKVGTEAKNLLQRDLGLGTGGGRRRRGENAGTPAQPATPTAGNSQSKSSQAAQPTPVAAAAPLPGKKPAETPEKPATPSRSKAAETSQGQVPTGPAATRAQAKGNANNSGAKNAQQKPEAQPAASPPSTQAFLKHANPSQGITEPLLQEAFATFGTVRKVEIDKKKGFAYVDFNEAGSLQKAIAASPVKVAQGQVVVLERKEGKSSQSRPRGGRGPGRGRGGRASGTDRADKGASSPSTVATSSTPATTESKP